jgi:RNA polymerase sigma-70 factor, ECF subfamily
MDPPAVTHFGQDTAGEATNLSTVYLALRRSLLAFLRKHTGDAQVAEDLLHDVVLKALVARRDPATTPRHLSGWLYAVARNAAMDHHRRAHPTEELPDDLRAPTDDDADAAVIELSSCLRHVAERLPGTYRDTLIAAEFEGRPLADVARVQGISLSAAKTRASRGRRLLQQQLVECCKVALSARGEVLDYDRCETAKCAPAAPADGRRAKPGH